MSSTGVNIPSIFLNKKVATSTPLKNKATVHQFGMTEWLSPVIRKSPRSGKLDDDKVQGTASKHSKKDIRFVQENENFHQVDQICALDKILDVQNNVDEGDVGLEMRKNKEMVLMDSEEEEGYLEIKNQRAKRKSNPTIVTRQKKKVRGEDKVEKHISNSEDEKIFSKMTDKYVKRKINTRSISCKEKKVLLGDKVAEPVPCVEKTVTSDSCSLKFDSPKITKMSDKAFASKRKLSKTETPKARKKNHETFENAELKDLGPLPTDTSSNLNEQRDADENHLRRSTRKRCKVLEFWNGERMEMDRDYPPGFGEVIENGRLVLLKKSKKVQQAKNVRAETRRGNTFINTCKPEARASKKRVIKGHRSILKSKTNIVTSTANVRFSSLGTGTTIERSTSEKNNNPDWLINFTEMQLAMEQSPISEDCVLYSGLSTADGLVSSAVMHLRPKIVIPSRAPDHKHLIFCVMEGTVKVTVDKISKKVEPCGHFAIPCGSSYSVESIARPMALLSFFTVACNCKNS